MSRARWIPCECDEWWCTLHGQHAFECPCPSVDELEEAGVDPYAEPEEEGD